MPSLLDRTPTYVKMKIRVNTQKKITFDRMETAGITNT